MARTTIQKTTVRTETVLVAGRFLTDVGQVVAIGARLASGKCGLRRCTASVIHACEDRLSKIRPVLEALGAYSRQSIDGCIRLLPFQGGDAGGASIAGGCICRSRYPIAAAKGIASLNARGDLFDFRIRLRAIDQFPAAAACSHRQLPPRLVVIAAGSFQKIRPCAGHGSTRFGDWYGGNARLVG